MIEQAQPKPSPHSRHHSAAGRNYSRNSAARMRSGNSSLRGSLPVFLDLTIFLRFRISLKRGIAKWCKLYIISCGVWKLSVTRSFYRTGNQWYAFACAAVIKLVFKWIIVFAAEDDDFLLQSIASVLPQSSPRREMSSIGSPPKKARAMTDEAARTSSGPKRFQRAAHSNSQSCMRHSQSRPDSIQLKKYPAKFPKSGSGSEVPHKGRGVVSPSTALFDAAFNTSSLVQSRQTTEKIRDASSLRRNIFEVLAFELFSIFVFLFVFIIVSWCFLLNSVEAIHQARASVIAKRSFKVEYLKGMLICHVRP